MDIMLEDGGASEGTNHQGYHKHDGKEERPTPAKILVFPHATEIVAIRIKAMAVTYSLYFLLHRGRKIRPPTRRKATELGSGMIGELYPTL